MAAILSRVNNIMDIKNVHIKAIDNIYYYSSSHHFPQHFAFNITFY